MPGGKSNYKITILGSGTSIGIPVPGCSCRVCKSKNKKDKRLRSSILIEYSYKERNYSVVIDTTPEFRLQALAADIRHLDAVFWTHAHADHLHGIDDLRGLSRKRPVQGYASGKTAKEIRTRFDYLWRHTQRGGGKPRIDLHTVNPGEIIKIGNTDFVPVPLKHGKLDIFGWRFGPAAYITDTNHIPGKSYRLLKDIKVLIIGALRFKEHSTHLTVERALEEIKKIKPDTAYFTHISHEVSHKDLLKAVPAGVQPAYDNLVIKC